MYLHLTFGLTDTCFIPTVVHYSKLLEYLQFIQSGVKYVYFILFTLIDMCNTENILNPAEQNSAYCVKANRTKYTCLDERVLKTYYHIISHTAF